MHLKDTSNLYKTTSPAATIEAEVEMTRTDLIEAISELQVEKPQLKDQLDVLKRKRDFLDSLSIVRDLRTLQYKILTKPFDQPNLTDTLARQVIRRLPYILFFDDFRDKIDEKILIDPS